MADIDIDVDDLKRRMDGAVSVLRQEFAGLRTGRASIAILDPVTVPAYGSQLPINQCATINVPDPRMITVNVWDRSLVSAVDKAIRDSGLGLNPVVDGTILRLPIPELNEERRGELARVAGKYAEGARIAVRNVRRDGMDQVKAAKGEGMSEDDQRLWSDEIQVLTDETIASIDEALKVKQEEIMQV